MPDTVPLPTPRPPSVFTILTRYRVMIMWLVVLSVIANGLTLVLPKLSANAIENADEIFFVNGGAITEAGLMEHAVNLLLHEKRDS